MKNPVLPNPGHYLHVHDFKKMILGANFFFDREKEKINALNVFPVPDGDTGTNMSMTLKAALEGSLSYEGHSIGELSEVVASRALMGARGNSGVILSQILRGIARGLRKKEHISPGELSKAFQYGVVYAYRAVSKPVEGTILTVAREMARAIRAAARKGANLYETIDEAIQSGRKTLAKTTDMLPVLKEAGVVDAGGLGLLVFIEGCLFALKRSVSELMPLTVNSENVIKGEQTEKPVFSNTETIDLEHPYCTEVIVKNENGNFGSLEAKLSPLGDSLVVVTDGGIAKIHIHSANPGKILQAAQAYGTLHQIKIENMLDQYEEVIDKAEPAEKAVIFPGSVIMEKGAAGLISVSFGEGFREIFLSLGADEIVYGGQTMNPNVEDLLNAVENLPQEAAFILPNNKNIIMVAEQVKALSNKEVQVVETRTLPEGLAALLAYNAASTVTENLTAMKEKIKKVKSGLVTYAIRDTVLEGSEIKTGHYLGLAGEKIIATGEELNHVALNLAEDIISKDHDLFTIFYGQEVSRPDASALSAAVAEKYPHLEIELQYGGQPIYYYIFSAE